MDQLNQLECRIAVLEANSASAEKALAIQAAEYDRRLNLLNFHEAKADEILKGYGSTYLTIERFDRFAVEVHDWRRKVDDFIASNNSSRATYVAMGAAALAVIPFLLQAWKLFAQ